MRLKQLILGLSAMMVVMAIHARAAEIDIGKPITINGMEISAVYLQPVIMDPMMPGLNTGSDVHLEADIHAQKGNKNGFGPGDWIPYLGVTYRIEKIGTDWQTFGAFMLMVANDGLHYGANVKLDGPRKYRLSYRITPPPYQGFYRHTDKETGVSA